MDASHLQTSLKLPLRKQWVYLSCCHLQHLVEIHFSLAQLMLHPGCRMSPWYIHRQMPP